MLFFDVEGERFKGFVYGAINLTVNYLRTGHSQFVTFPAHRFYQHRKVQLTPTAHFKTVRVIRVFDHQRNIVQGFGLQALANLAAGNVLTLAAGERRVIDTEHHC